MDTDKAQDVKSREEARALINKCRKLLIEEFGAQRVIPFGSVTGNGLWHQGSDLDLAVEGLPDNRFFEALSAVQDLVSSQIRVDLVPLEDAKPKLRSHILGEVEMSEDSTQALRDLITEELETLEQLVEEVKGALEKLSSPPTQLDLHGIASYIHDFYSGIESIFERIVVELDEGLPRGEYWHAELLEQVAVKRENIRPRIINEPLRAKLKEYLRFRHFFRHAYGVKLKWVQLRPLAEGMELILNQLTSQIEGFFDQLSSTEKSSDQYQ